LRQCITLLEGARCDCGAQCCASARQGTLVLFPVLICPRRYVVCRSCPFRRAPEQCKALAIASGRYKAAGFVRESIVASAAVSGLAGRQLTT
jgi:hypothetical protein